MKFKTEQFNVLVPFSVKSDHETEVVDKTGDDVLVIEGYCNWSGDDEYGKVYSDLAGDVVVPAGVETSVWERNPQILLQHDRGETIGRGMKLEKRGDGVWVSCEIHKKAVDERDFYRIQSGLLSMFSIGFRTMDAEFKEVDGQSLFYITKSLLLEISVVSIPCNSMSGFNVIKALPNGDGSISGDFPTKRLDLEPEPKEEEASMMKVKVKYADYLASEELDELKKRGVDIDGEVEMSLVDLIKRLAQSTAVAELETYKAELAEAEADGEEKADEGEEDSGEEESDEAGDDEEKEEDLDDESVTALKDISANIEKLLA